MARIIIRDLLKQHSILSGEEMDEVQGGRWASRSYLKGYRYRTFYGDKTQKFRVSEYRKITTKNNSPPRCTGR